MNVADVIDEFVRAMEIEGVRPLEPIAHRLASGELIRFRCDGDGKSRENGWAKLYLDGRPAGAFGNYRMGVDKKWKSGADYAPMTPEERAKLQREWAEAKEARRAEQERSEREAAVDAREMWARAVPASSGHTYAAKKRLDVSSLRQLNGKLLIPMVDQAGDLWNLQRIAEDGTKRFLKGGRTMALFCIIGAFSGRGQTCCIGEGYSTMAAVHRATGHPCIVSFSAKNMAAVARLWNSARPDLDFVICGDDDAHLDRNVGRECALAAAEAIGARVTFPKTKQEAA